MALVFNGDFNWFNVEPESFARVNEAVLAHAASLGNVEAELAREDSLAGCGCNYPAYVEPAVPERSDRIHARLKETALGFPGLRGRLGGLPAHLVLRVGPRRIGVLHGDAQSLAGWSLAEEALRELAGRAADDGPGAPAPQTPRARVESDFRRSGLDAFATTHTCLPFAQDLEVDGTPRVLVNNGSAGMPNFRGLRCGLLTRISAGPAVPPESLYGLARGGVRYDALPIAYDHERWLRRFLRNWPEGSPGHRSYFERIAHGPAYGLAQAVRGGVEAYRARRSA